MWGEGRGLTPPPSPPHTHTLTHTSTPQATDPVAVVALLKDVGASPVLTMQIMGESLLNDGYPTLIYPTLPSPTLPPPPLPSLPYPTLPNPTLPVSI